MKSHSLVSVIMPAFNHELYIEEALQSIKNQTYSNIELIVINDGSTDSTARIIEEYIKKNNTINIRYINKANEGVCRTLNIGLEMATGDYIAFLASDDVWLPERLEIQLEFLENNKNIAMVFSDVWFLHYTTRTHIKWSDYKPIINKYFRNGIQNTDIYYALLIQPFVPALSVLIRKHVLLDVGLIDETLAYEDHDLWLRIASKYPIGYINQPLAFYRVHKNNMSNNVSFMIMGMFQTVKKHFKQGLIKNRPMKKIIVVCLLTYNIIVSRIKKKLTKLLIRS